MTFRSAALSIITLLCISFFAFSIFVSTASAADRKSEIVEHAMELMRSLLQAMTVTYLCQPESGPEIYRKAKAHTEKILSAFFNDTNKAIIGVDQFEQKLKTDCPEPSVCLIQQIRNTDKDVNHEDIHEACSTMINSAIDDVNLLSAKMGILASP